MGEDIKRSMKLLNYYDEYSNYLSSLDGTDQGGHKYLVFEKLRFLGIEDMNLLRFELNNECQIRRRINDNYFSYEALTDIDYNEDDIKKIIFKEITTDANENVMTTKI